MRVLREVEVSALGARANTIAREKEEEMGASNSCHIVGISLSSNASNLNAKEYRLILLVS